MRTGRGQYTACVKPLFERWLVIAPRLRSWGSARADGEVHLPAQGPGWELCRATKVKNSPTTSR